MNADGERVNLLQPPVLKALRTELLNQVTVEWTSSRANSIPVAGYKVLLNGTSDFKINGKPASEPLPADCNTTTIDHLAPGRTVKVRSLSCHSSVKFCVMIFTPFLKSSTAYLGGMVWLSEHVWIDNPSIPTTYTND